ncbi:MAG TPA: sensor histidine kinase, partial [Verrucomicrobiae bacterium]
TFKGRFHNRDYYFVQTENSVIRINLQHPLLASQFKPGQAVDMGGALSSERPFSVLSPLVVTPLGDRMMPVPVSNPVNFNERESLEGKWTELEGVGRGTNEDGTLTLAGRFGSVKVWLAPEEMPLDPATLVDAHLMVRGVLLLSGLDTPTLLVPSAKYTDVLESPTPHPFARPRLPIAELKILCNDPLARRVHLAGIITHTNANYLVIQDASGGLRVNPAPGITFPVGTSVEVIGFPAQMGMTRQLSDATIARRDEVERIQPQLLEISDGAMAKWDGMLVQVHATLLGVKVHGFNYLFELQQGAAIFTATLADPTGPLTNLMAGCRLSLTGICEELPTAMGEAGEKSGRPQLLTPVNVQLRTPADLAVIAGPPWWTWKRVIWLGSLLIATLLASVLRVWLLQLKLKRQRAAQLAFSRHVFRKVEEERQRIAMNLHDSLGQMLLHIKNNALLAGDQQPPLDGAQQRLEQISTTSTQAIEEVRRIARGLWPYQLDRLGLTQAIRTLIATAAENGQISFASRIEDVDQKLDQERELHVFRILQEAINNILKHSRATEATIVVKSRPDSLALSIRDNGQGFDKAAAATPPAGGFGLNAIQERIRILGGTLKMESGQDTGTMLNMEIPFTSPPPA